MIRVAPFKAVIYNQDKVKELAKVVCPPYDIISPARQEYYHQLHPQNFIHILLGKDIPGEDKYQRAAADFKNWFKNNTLIIEEKPAIYFYSQEYAIKGEKKTRLGFIARLSLDDKNSSVFCHEHTRLEPKEDRLKIIREVEANLSPIFLIFSDKKRIIQRTFQQHLQSAKPFIDIVDDERIRHKVWRLENPEVLSAIQSGLEDANIFIADGHHRYEVACAYRDEMIKKHGKINGEEGFNYIMAYFTAVESSGLTVFAVHRLVHLDAKFDLQTFRGALSVYFDIEEIKDKTRFFFLLEKAGHAEHVLGMYKDGQFWMLRLKNIKILDKMVTDKPPEYKTLDVSVLNYIILKKIMGLDLEDKKRIAFSPNPQELIAEANNSHAAIVFFTNPVRVEQIISLALKGERMPSKSTYFYPKVLSGLVINKLE